MSGVPLGAAADAIESTTAMLENKTDQFSGQAKGLEAVGALLLGGDSRHPLL